MTYFDPAETPKRRALLERAFKECNSPFEANNIEGAIKMTSSLTLKQLESAVDHVIATHDGKSRASIVNRIRAAVDRDTRDRQRADDVTREAKILPMVTIDTTRTRQQLAILERHAKPVSKATWTEAELDDIRLDLELDARRGLAATWIEKQRAKHPPLVLDPAVYGPPPDPLDTRIPDAERRAELARQLRARLAHLDRIGAGPRRVAGVMSIGGVTRRDVEREPGAEG
jgi:hypothetical protein